MGAEQTGIIRVAITSDLLAHRSLLQQSIQQSGLQVVLNEPLSRYVLNRIQDIDCDVLILDLSNESDHAAEYLDQLLEQQDIPVIVSDVSALTLNNSGTLKKWHHNLLHKIADVTGRSNWQPDVDTAGKLPLKSAHRNLAKNVWVLGASLGGPDAVKKFLTCLDANLPVAFILAQHVGANFVSILAEQLNRYTPFDVKVASQGHVLHHGGVLVVPVDQRVVVNQVGVVELKPYTFESTYTPSIDTVLADMTHKYRQHAGAIIFSGMCDDGVNGCIQVVDNGGEVWIQNPESCVIAEMPGNVARYARVSFSGDPEQLAQHMMQKFTGS